jgi:uncharacterized protein (DUF2461 family)
VRTPRPYDPDHRFAADLRRKDFIASVRLSEKQITDGGFLNEFTGLCRTATPFMRFLCQAVGVPF